MPLQNFVDNSTPTIDAAWLNAIDAFYYSVFQSATTAALARAAVSAAMSGANTDITSLASPALASATATTQSPGDSSTKVATTAFLAAAAAAALAATNVYTKNQSVTPVAVTATSTAVINSALSNNFTITPTQNFTLSAATNPTNGMIINVVFTQGSTPYVITWDAVWQFPGGTEPTLTASANAIDFMSAYYNGATSKWICVMNKDFKA
jgi:hypothetical protein